MNIKSFALTGLAALSLVACHQKEQAKSSPELKISFNHNGRLFVNYNRDNPLELPDGSIVRKGDLTPVFNQIQNKVGAQIKDVASKSGDTAVAMIKLASSRQFKTADVYGGNSTLQSLEDYGTKGYFVPLNEHFDQMPNLKAYLDKNPGIYNQLKTSDGNIYAMPYAAEIGNYARLFHLRYDWVKKLLDNNSTDLDTQKSITTNYKPFYTANDYNNVKIFPEKNSDISITKNLDKDSENIISIQNKLGEDGLTGKEAVTALRKYIDQKYMTQGVYKHRSDLFLGKDAAYDADELVALWRAVKLNPKTLVGDANKDIVVYYARKTTDKQDLIRLTTFFGARAFGSDSYNSKAIVTKGNKLEYAWAKPEFLKAMDKVSEIYSEGLINEDFENYPSGASDFRSYFNRNNIGFMIHDWSASTTIFNDVMKDSKDPAAKGFSLSAVLPPVTKYHGKFIQYMENTRVVKPDGWAISKNASPEALTAALKMFDYIYTEEGKNLVNYGPEGITWEGKWEYEGKSYPKFKQWTIDQATKLNSGNVCDFLRYSIGGQMPIGYQKEVGLELETAPQIGLDELKMMNNSNVLQLSYTSEDPNYKLTPTILPLTENESDVMSEEITLEDYIQSNIFLIMKKGFGYSDDLIKTPTKQQYLDGLKKAGLEKFNAISTKAYQRGLK